MIVVVLASGVIHAGIRENTKREKRESDGSSIFLDLDLRLQAATPSGHL